MKGLKVEGLREGESAIPHARASNSEFLKGTADSPRVRRQATPPGSLRHQNASGDSAAMPTRTRKRAHPQGAGALTLGRSLRKRLGVRIERCALYFCGGEPARLKVVLIRRKIARADCRSGSVLHSWLLPARDLTISRANRTLSSCRRKQKSPVFSPRRHFRLSRLPISSGPWQYVDEPSPEPRIDGRRLGF